MAVANYQAAESALMCHGEGQVPNGAAGLHLLGRIARLTGRDQAAAAWFVKALRADPMLWSAYDQLCALGARWGGGRGVCCRIWRGWGG